MATRKKERLHKTGKSNRKSYFNLSDYENSNNILKVFNNSKNSSNDDVLNNNKLKFNFEIDKTYSDKKNNKNISFHKNLYSEVNKTDKEKLQKFIIENQKKNIKQNDIELVELNKKKENDENYLYSKGDPCRFKKNKCKKKIDVINLNNENKIKDKVNKEYNVSELWNYLNFIHNSEDSRLRYKIREIIEEKNRSDIEKNINKKDVFNNMNGKNKLIKEENFDYDEYKNIIKYILPSMADSKIKHSWDVLKSNLKSQSEQINYNEFYNFLNETTGNNESKYVNKIVCSKLKNKILKHNFVPSDVQLKTINYVDNIRSKASEFSRDFKELITEKELEGLFKGKEKIKKTELENQIMDIISKKTKDIYYKEIDTNFSNKEELKELEKKIFKKKEGLTNFNMKAYISTLLTNKNDEVLVKHFIENLSIDYDSLNNKNKNIKDAYDFYSRNIPPTENIEESYTEEMNEEEIKRAKFLIEEIDYSVRNNFKPNYVSANINKKDSEKSYLSLYEIFKHLDIDKDSYITKDDLNKCFNKLKMKNVNNNDVNILLKYIDTQRKGYISINDFLRNYHIEEKSMINWIKNTNKPYFEFIKNLKGKSSRARCTSESVLNNKNASTAKKYEDIIYNYNLELDTYCPSYVIRERIRDDFIAKKEDFLNKHLNATRFHLTEYKNTNNLIEPIQNSDLYMNDSLRFKTTYNLNYN
ncbi:conserved Plasmodium protein, unknown function [Plasmodium gallinaceum]|uniref:EF-hand domain-containing protein n=1 Tax=Plasmodium gallinaceum TaxID=5849 RepID=A0A1J1GVA7_PLAGA|nr:conserved Plasmodium protein, unknown function [Plasmodium gallinaceum]CRG96429.1 conserved Plasmodium protein, unknown function [Plasmodium gallinaceum]